MTGAPKTPSGRKSDNRASSGSAGERSHAPPSTTMIENKNLDLSAEAYGASLVSRPKPSTLGQTAKIGLNTFAVDGVPAAGKDIFQYDVVIGSGTEKRGLMKKVWHASAVQSALRGFIWDGNALAWSLVDHSSELSIVVDLDKEQGRTPREGGKKNECRIIVRRTKRIRFASLTEYLAKHTEFSTSVLECINFFDHLLRETPSKKLVQIKRSFFQRASQPTDLGGAVEAFKGVYQSLAITHNVRTGAGLSVNVDVSNGTFWHAKPLLHVAQQLCGRRDINDLAMNLERNGPKGRDGQTLRKFHKLRVSARHRGNNTVDGYTIQRLIYQSAQDYKFEKDGKKISIYDYFAQTYRIRLQYPKLPLVETTKKGVLPMEVLTVDTNQRYMYKLDERQTSNMIKFAVTPPDERYQAISNGLQMLDWAHDPVLQAYGVRISTNRTVVDGRIITAPKVQFGKGEAKPGTSGRWDLKDKRFLTTNPAPLKSWSVCVIPGRVGGKPDKATVENFIKAFIQAYTNHGGKVENKQPAFVLGPPNGGDAVTTAWNAAGNQSNSRPQMLVFILPDKNTELYGRIKRSCECKYGVVSQCMQYAHVIKAQPQYISNVLMKFNAKLGGATGRAIGAKSAGPTGLFTVPTLVIGADVSHGAPGMQVPSVAALTMSMDKLGIRYAAQCDTNGYRVEMITTSNINGILEPLVQAWKKDVGQGQNPRRVIYLRDGVSERQYKHVLEQEVQDMKALFKRITGSNIEFLVIVGGKRHHIRFFPERGDRNKNPLPGTLVETGVTHPFENDFYLCSHAAIKGTARPMHYHVLLNDPKLSNEEIQTILYEQCYQFVRSTTPVSQHPAIYYAHIASNRAVPHDAGWAKSTETQSQAGDGATSTSASAAPPVEKLMPMPNGGGINNSMWFI